MLTIDAEDGVVPIDFDDVASIVSHLIENLGEHTPPGTVAWLTIARAGEALSIAVDDDGPGIPADVRQEVFELFATGDSDRPRAGVGLWVVDRLARRYGGKAWVEERPVAVPRSGSPSRGRRLKPCNEASGERQVSIPELIRLAAPTSLLARGLRPCSRPPNTMRPVLNPTFTLKDDDLTSLALCV